GGQAPRVRVGRRVPGHLGSRLLHRATDPLRYGRHDLPAPARHGSDARLGLPEVGADRLGRFTTGPRDQVPRGSHASSTVQPQSPGTIRLDRRGTVVDTIPAPPLSGTFTHVVDPNGGEVYIGLKYTPSPWWDWSAF